MTNEVDVTARIGDEEVWHEKLTSIIGFYYKAMRITAQQEGIGMAEEEKGYQLSR